MKKYAVKYIEIDNGERLAYREIGESKNIMILIHGNMSSSLHFAPIFEKLSEDFKIYAVDLRGFGESSYNNRINSLKDFSDDINSFANKMELKDFIMVGWSTGGGICLQFEADYPGIAKKLVLIESVSYLGYPLFKKDAEGQMIVGEVYSSREEMAKDPVQVAPAVAAMEANDFDYMSFLWDIAIYTSQKPNSEDNEIYIKESLKQRNLVDLDWALATFNMSDKHNGYSQGTGLIDKINIPVLSFFGKKDVVVLENMVRETVEAIGSNAEMVILENSGHSPLIDCPEIVMNRIIEFAGKVGEK